MLFLVVRHYGYYHFPEALHGEIWNISGALCLCVFVLVARPWFPIALWAISEELLVVGCSVWWILDPVSLSGDQCSARIGFKLSAISLVFVAFMAWRYATAKVYSVYKQE